MSVDVDVTIRYVTKREKGSWSLACHESDRSVGQLEFKQSDLTTLNKRRAKEKKKRTWKGNKETGKVQALPVFFKVVETLIEKS